MGSLTSIQWTDRSWNPWQGCTKVSPGCAHCYMFRDHERYGKGALASVVRRSAPATFNAPLKWEREAVNTRGLTPEPVRVFTCSWSDWFHEAADEWRADAWAIVRQTPHLTYQILTKRPERIAAALPPDWGATGYPNVWLGVSAEYQRQANERIPLLLRVPAVVRFVSAEPLLGPIDLRSIPYRGDTDYLLDVLSGTYRLGPNDATEGTPFCFGLASLGRIHWVIIGGESGGKEARRFAPKWAASLIEQCLHTRAAPFLKQLGSVWAREHHAKDWHGGLMEEWPEDLRVRQFPMMVPHA